MIPEMKKGLVILRRDGLSEAILAGLRLYNMNIEGYIYYYRYLLLTKCLKKKKSTSAFDVTNIDPENITKMPKDPISRWEYLGISRDGGWDQETKKIRSSMKFRSVYNHFAFDTPWEDTDMYQYAMNRVKNGEICWNGCRTVKDVEKRTEEIDQLYIKIKTEGYKSQSEIQAKDIKSLLLSTSFDRSKEEIAVAIGRAGEFLFIDGNHRLAIAKALDLEKIPVHVIFRHSMWEEIRQEIKQSSDLAQLDDKIISYIDHPDIKTLI